MFRGPDNRDPNKGSRLSHQPFAQFSVKKRRQGVGNQLWIDRQYHRHLRREGYRQDRPVVLCRQQQRGSPARKLFAGKLLDLFLQRLIRPAQGFERDALKQQQSLLSQMTYIAVEPLKGRVLKLRRPDFHAPGGAAAL
ncbi:hypothetical protein SDC9_174336 [bioreactor metagenome]|uniref:Uncharacterized protein n=1 Tax=bioreactor metagenome TaxID=1076179 RepID=A0A645GL84_9ZZZZ